jgi:hypothetical protein
MVVGWYHSHPGFGCWLSGTDINTQQVRAAVRQPPRPIRAARAALPTATPRPPRLPGRPGPPSPP